MKEQLCVVHKQESLVRFTKTNDQKREEENLNELKRETTQNSTDPKYQICF